MKIVAWALAHGLLIHREHMVCFNFYQKLTLAWM